VAVYTRSDQAYPNTLFSDSPFDYAQIAQLNYDLLVSLALNHTATSIVLNAGGGITITLSGDFHASVSDTFTSIHLTGTITAFSRDNSIGNIERLTDFSLPLDLTASANGVTGAPDYSSVMIGQDVLTGGASTDILAGFAGDDTLNGGAGADTLNGGAGIDLVSYANSASGLFASLATPDGNTGDAMGDSYLSIEGLIGSQFGDTLASAATGSNQLWGGAGADQLYALGGHDYVSGGADDDSIFSNGGSNTIDGGGGFDFVRYDYAPAAVIANLGGASPNAGAAAGDRYASVEGFVGSAFNDVAFGDGDDNQLYGQSGNDYLYGQAGNDAVFGGTGNDSLVGGPGFDVLYGGLGGDNFFINSPADGYDYIGDFKPSDYDALVLTSANFGGITSATIASHFYAGAGFGGFAVTGPYLAFDTTNGNLWYNTSGAPTLVAQLPGTMLSSSSLYFV
jgi:Ca2+-binding RTX toxin-like protein